MPQIKQYTADSPAAVTNLSNRAIPYNDYSGLDFAGKQLAQVGENTVKIGGALAREEALSQEKARVLREKMQKQQNILDVSDLKSRYDQGLDLLKINMSKATLDENGNIVKPAADPAQFPQIFYDGAQKIVKSLDLDKYNQEVQVEMVKHAREAYRPRFAAVVQEADRIMLSAQHAAIAARTNDLAQVAGGSMDPETVASAIKSHNEVIAGARELGYLTPEAAQKQKLIFTEKSLEANARMLMFGGFYTSLRERDRNGVYDAMDPDKRAQILSEARSREYTDQQHAETQKEKARHVGLEQLWEKANSGKLTEADLKSEFVKPHEAHALAARNDDPVFGDNATLAVRALKQEYELQGNRTVGLVERYLKKLNELNVSLGGTYSKSLERFARELQVDASAARNTDAALKAAGIKVYDQALKEMNDSTGIPRIDRFGKPQRDREEGEDKKAILGGEDPEKVIKRRQEQRKKKIDDIPPPQKKVNDILQRIRPK